MSDANNKSGEADTAAETVSATLRLVPGNYDDAPALYSNFVQVTLSPHDFTMHLGWYATPALDPANPPPAEEPVDVAVRPLATVSLPPTLIRGLIRVLEAQATVFEANTGAKLVAEPLFGSEEPT